jgi:hypothetical protein
MLLESQTTQLAHIITISHLLSYCTYQLALIPNPPMIGSRSHDGHHVPGHFGDPQFCTKNSCKIGL